MLRWTRSRQGAPKLEWLRGKQSRLARSGIAVQQTGSMVRLELAIPCTLLYARICVSAQDGLSALWGRILCEHALVYREGCSNSVL